MSHVQDDQLYEHASRLKGRVVVITGAASGIGRETALQLALYGAKVVIGDLDEIGAERTARDIEAAGGQAVSLKCNVINWEEQVAMFELAISTYGAVDIVVPNAGIGEVGSFVRVTLEDGKPVKPKTRTVDVNLIGAAYTVHLSLHYLEVNRTAQSDTLKAIVFIGSVASWVGIPLGVMYSASKHAILGMMRSMYPVLLLKNIRVATIHPFFADTNIIPAPMKVFLAGIPLTPVPRIAGAIIYAATHPDPETSGRAFLLPDNGPVFMVPREEFKFGVYDMINNRANALLKGAAGVQFYARLVKDLVKLLAKPIGIVALGAVVVKFAWNHQEEGLRFIQRYAPS